MKFAYKLLIHVAKIFTCCIPVKTVRRQARDRIINILAPLPLLFIRRTVLYKRLLAIVQLSRAYQYSEYEIYRLPDTKENIFQGINEARNVTGGGGSKSSWNFMCDTTCKRLIKL